MWWLTDVRAVVWKLSINNSYCSAETELQQFYKKKHTQTVYTSLKSIMQWICNIYSFIHSYMVYSKQLSQCRDWITAINNTHHHSLNKHKLQNIIKQWTKYLKMHMTHWTCWKSDTPQQKNLKKKPRNVHVYKAMRFELDS